MRRLRLTVAGAVTLALLSAASGTTLAEQAETTEATSEVLFGLSVPDWALPGDITHLEVAGWTLGAGTDVAGEPQASQANESMRNRAFMVTSGEFLIEPTTEALVWRAPGATPEVTPSGAAVTLQPGEAIYLPAVAAEGIDPERYLRVANPGAVDSSGVTLHVHEGSTTDRFGGLPSGPRWSTWSGDLIGLRTADEWIAADEVRFQLTRHLGDPGATIAPSVASATPIYLIESGTVERTISGPADEFTDSWRAGAKISFPARDSVEQTLTVVGDEPGSVLELVAVPGLSASQ